MTTFHCTCFHGWLWEKKTQIGLTADNFCYITDSMDILDSWLKASWFHGFKLIKYWLSSICLVSTTINIHGMGLRFSSVQFYDFALAGGWFFCSRISSMESNMFHCSQYCEMLVFLMVFVKTQVCVSIAHRSITVLSRPWSTCDIIILSHCSTTKVRYFNCLLSFS